MFREMAFGGGKTSQDVAMYAESVKRFFENNLPPGVMEIHINAEVDRLFSTIVSDIKNLEND